jgi:hypothetical protein
MTANYKESYLRQRILLEHVQKMMLQNSLSKVDLRVPYFAKYPRIIDDLRRSGRGDRSYVAFNHIIQSRTGPR